MKRPWLAPLVPLYAAGIALREFRTQKGWEPARRLSWPVVSVGNLSTGGAGKTPFAIALVALLKSRGFHVDVLSRGYGRSSREPAHVHRDGMAAESGDEPLLIATETGVPVYVAPQRYDAGVLAESEFAAQHIDGFSRKSLAHILDDGFQHRQLARDVDVLLLSESDLKDSLLPAGNLREPLRAVKRANAIAVPADEVATETELRRVGWAGPVWRFRRRMKVPAIDGPVLAFCGIAKPEQFFAGLEAAGVPIVLRRAFADHYQYTAKDMRQMAKIAGSAGAKTLITTEKDLVRVGSLATSLPKETSLKTVPLRIEIEDTETVVSWLLERLAGATTLHKSL